MKKHIYTDIDKLKYIIWEKYEIDDDDRYFLDYAIDQLDFFEFIMARLINPTQENKDFVVERLLNELNSDDYYKVEHNRYDDDEEEDIYPYHNWED